MEQERQRAQQLGYEDPINPNYDATSAMYEKNLDFFMKKIIETGKENQRFAIMVASHNEDTVRYTIKRYDVPHIDNDKLVIIIFIINNCFHWVGRMQELGITPEDRVICFGQLFGMSDQVSFNLGNSLMLGYYPMDSYYVHFTVSVWNSFTNFSRILGQSGYSVYKYVPYGPIDEVCIHD